MITVKIKNTKENYKKVVRMVQHYEDMVICAECKADKEAAEKELVYWEEQLTNLRG